MAKNKKKVQELDLKSLTDARRKELKDGLNLAVVHKTHCTDALGIAKDHLKNLSDNFGIEVSVLKSATESIYNQSFFDKVRKQDIIEEVLTVAGLLSQAGSDEE